MKPILSLLVAITFVCAAAAAQAKSAAELYQDALQYEEVKGDAETAIALYEQVIQRAGANRALAARAQLHIALCLELLGRPESAAAFAKVIRNYADQPEAVAQARARQAAGMRVVPNGTALVEHQQVWSVPDLQFSGRPSLDGRYVTYLDSSSPDVDNVGVRDLTTGENRLLTRERYPGADEEGANAPSISPDNRRIAFGWEQKGVFSIRLINMDGTGLRVLATPDVLTASGNYWSPDGRRLAVVLLHRGLTSEIAVVDAADGRITRLASFVDKSVQLGGFSPDGKWLVYGAVPLRPTPSSPATGELHALAIDGSARTTLLSDGHNNRQPAWTPNGQSIVYLSLRAGAIGLWAINVASGRPAGTPIDLGANLNGTIMNKGFTRDGRFVYGAEEQDRDVFVATIDPNTLNVTSAPRRLSNRAAGSNTAPLWSPDGRSVAFLRGERPGNQAIVIASENGVERELPTRLVNTARVAGFPFVWHPSGDSLLVRDVDASDAARAVVRRIDAQTGASLDLLQAPEWDVSGPLEVSPDGRYIFYTSVFRRVSGNLNRQQLKKRDLQTNTETVLFERTTNNYTIAGLMISPDGSRLAFLDSDWRLVTVSTDGGTAVLLDGQTWTPVESVFTWARAWTSDARHIISKAADGSVWAIPASGGTARKLHWPLPEVGDISPDRTRTVFFTSTRRSELRIIENLLDRIKSTR